MQRNQNKIIKAKTIHQENAVTNSGNCTQHHSLENVHINFKKFSSALKSILAFDIAKNDAYRAVFVNYTELIKTDARFLA